MAIGHRATSGLANRVRREGLDRGAVRCVLFCSLELTAQPHALQPKRNERLELAQALLESLAFLLGRDLGELALQRGAFVKELDLGRGNAGVFENLERKAELRRSLVPAFGLR